MLDTVTVEFVDHVTVHRREHVADFVRVFGHSEDSPESESEQKCDDTVGNTLSLDVVKSRIVTVLPNDVSRLRGFFELEWLVEQFTVTLLVEGKEVAIFFFEGDETRGRHGQRVEVLDELVDLLVASLHILKLVMGNSTTSDTKFINKRGVVEGEDNISNLDLANNTTGSLSLLFFTNFAYASIVYS